MLFLRDLNTLDSKGLGDGWCCGAWSKEGAILFATGQSSALHRIGADGGPSAVATRVDPSVRQPYPASPQFLPDGWNSPLHAR